MASGVLVQVTTPAVMDSVTGAKHHGGPVWWIITRDGDIYPEELALTENIRGLRGCSLDGSPDPSCQIGYLRYLPRVLAYTPLRTGQFMDIKASVEKE